MQVLCASHQSFSVRQGSGSASIISWIFELLYSDGTKVKLNVSIKFVDLIISVFLLDCLYSIFIFH